MPFSYANPTSGPSAGAIGWFNFENLVLNPGGSASGLTGTLNDGTIVTFDISLALDSGTARPFTAVTVPTFPTANFGVTGYTGLTGNVALAGNLIPQPTVSTITISNIVVTDASLNPIPNYTVILADAERTNLGEQLQWQSNGGGWKLLATLGANPPTLTGLGTQTAVITGNNLVEASAYVLTAQTPTQVAITVTNAIDSRQGVSIGFATTRLRVQKNVAARIDSTDQFVLNINGTPASQATTTGNVNGIQTQVADIYAIPDNIYTVNESIAPGSGSTLADYIQTVSAANSTPAGSVPPTGTLPINFTPALGDNVIYTILNAAPETFSKTVDKAFANLGDILTYTITVDNPNNFAVNNVLVTDPLPIGTTYIGNLSVSAPFTGTDPQTGLTITTIAPNSFVTISYQVQVNSDTSVSTPIANVANVSVPDGTSGVTNVVTTQVNTAFVTANKMVDKAFATTGDVLTYTIMLNNAGNVPANNVIITDAIPTGTTFVPGSVTGATGAPPNLTLIGSIGAGQTRTVTFQVQVGDTVPNPNPVPNSASAAYTYTVDPANPNGASGTAQSNTPTTLINTADITTTKTVSQAFANAGDVLTYTLVLQNNGNTAANNVAITDAIPAGTTFVPGSVTGAIGTPPNLTLANPIPAGGSATVTFQVLVGNTVPTPNPLSNTANSTFTFTIDPANPDGATGTSASNAATTQVNIASITTNKIVDKAFANIGDVLTYTLVLQNTGNTPANNVVITDNIPAGTSYIGGSLTGATGMPPTITLLNPIPAGGNATVSFQVLVGNTIPVTNPVPNSASVAFTYTVNPANPDGANGTDNSNTVTTQINNASIISVKTADKAFANVGDTITYTITLQNTGNVPANSVVLTDAIPAGTTFVTGSLTGATGTPPTLTLISPVPAGGIATVTFQVKVNTIPSTNPLPNTANAAFVYTVNPVDPNAVSGTSASNTVDVQVNNATLAIEKSTDKSISYLGDTITYQLAITNKGNVPANNVVINDVIVPGTDYIPGTLTVNVPFTGTPATGIQLTNPVAPGQMIAISFQAKVATMPLPNPIVNKATVNYTYTVDPANPNGVTATATSNAVDSIVFRNNYTQQINDLIESVALEQAALAAIANSEGAKIQKMVALGTVTTQELLCLNSSVASMLDSISLLEAILKQKLNVVDCQINGTC